jgi:NAD(P)-dependent dehydrogenase (short-subunit alcohol dehydrogenase family)
MNDRQVAIVTGGTRGVGFETARQLAGRGFRVFVTGRSQASTDEAVAQLRALASPAGVEAMVLDLGDFASVRRFAEAFRARGLPLHLLINNAGTMVTDQPRRANADGVESILAANAIGPFLLTHLLLEHLRASSPARVVNVSSRSHMPGSGLGAEVEWDWEDPNGERRWDAMRFYKNSKLAVMWLTYELSRRLAGSGVVAHAACPGFVPSTLAETARGGRRFFMKYVARFLPTARTVEQAAANTLLAATGAAYGEQSGAFLGEEKEVRSSDQSYDEAQARRFWEWAAQRAGVEG